MNRKCIFCKKNSEDGNKFELTDEHVIPEMIGGWITIPFVCKDCNNHFGSNIESKLKKNIFIVSAIDKLKIQPPEIAYKSAQVTLEFPGNIKTKGKIVGNGSVEFRPTLQDDGSLITPEGGSKDFLRKKIKRYEKAKKEKVKFDINEYDRLPYDIVIPINNTGISFIKRKDQKATIVISDLSEPILFMLPAKIAFEHLAGFSYNFIQEREFDLFGEWILNEDVENKVRLNTVLSRMGNPKNLNYLPYHFIRYSLFDNDLVALVGLFGFIIFSVFIFVLDDISKFPNNRILDIYHIYDLNEKNFFSVLPLKRYSRLIQFI